MPPRLRAPTGLLLAAAAATAVLATPRAAGAEEFGEPEPAWQREPARRRAGFTAGFALGAGIAANAGFPNDVKAIGRERFYTESGLALQGGGTLWVGACLTDWFVFGLGGTYAGAVHDGGSSPAGAFVFHVEAYPLYGLGGAFQDLGGLFEAGTGVATTTDDDGKKLVDSGGASRIGVGAFYEGFRVWRLATGPYVQFDYMWSEAARRPSLMLGLRTSIFTGKTEPASPPRAARR